MLSANKKEEQPLRSHMSVSSASCSQWKISYGASANHGEKKKKTKHNMSGWWCGACGMPYDWRKPNRLLTLQVGDTANDLQVLLACSAFGGECDRIVMLKLITNLVKGHFWGGGQWPRRKQQEQVGGSAGVRHFGGRESSRHNE